MSKMRHKWVGTGGLMLLAILTGGCAGMSNTAKGIGVGGGLGAGAGAAVAALTGGDVGTGAAIGAGLGGVSGGLIGNDLDQQEHHQMQNRVIQAEAREAAAHAQAQALQSPPLNVGDVVALSQQGLSDDVIINQIRSTGSTYELTTADLQWLQQSRVSDRVIVEMQNRRPGIRPAVIRQEPVVIQHAPAPVVIRRPAPVYVIDHHYAPPPPALHFGFGFHRHHCWD